MLATKPVMITDELRRQCDEFVDFSNIISAIGRPPEERVEHMRKRVEAQFYE